MIYFIFFIASSFLIACAHRKKPYIQRIVLFGVVFAFSLLSGLRASSVGSDTAAYPLGCYKIASISGSFEAYDNHVTDLYYMGEIGYKVLAYVCAKVCDDFNFFLFVCALIVNGSFLYFFSYLAKSNKFPLWILWLSYCCMMFHQSMNLAKQFIAISLCLIAYVCFEKGKKKISLALFACAMTFHFTMVAFFTIYFLKYLKSNIVRIALIVCIVLTVSGNYFFIYGVMDRFELFHRFAIYLKNKDGDVPLFEVMYHSLFLVVPYALYKCKLVKLDKTIIENYSYLICVEISFFMFNMISAQAGRMGMYLLPLCLGYMPLVAANSRCRSTILLLYALSLIAFWYITIVIQGSTCSFPYESKFL